ncbi:hypothetical protein HYPSUDRAFT_38481 [Hypholoma sublateritium FD-334 SS-4]|uniref:Uncharacterized protein n=1 Tax=Hypholoma sublateritium (strain FD-334 SS-4) TaxID=945553 RepID=A0A0D2P847_HYPSF|nr:hypothetical protein HYPSUDRAFT_38481 [Hypholoma sublateritium FD-334 SS-4]
MPVNSSSIPVNLNNDVLLSIFTMNADMFSDERALNTTRIASQVSRQWRDLLLDTPSIWAKLIDMNGIRCAPSYEWGNEVIRRSGFAPLWIKADSYSIADHLRTEAANRYYLFNEFFVSCIRGNWRRIQKLVIKDLSCSFCLTLAMLCFPAPQLEEFDVSRPDLDEEIGRSSLFAGDAPILRRFSFGYYVVDPAAPWLHHLHFIELDSAYSIRDALAVLSATLNLQELKIDDLMISDLSIPLPIVSLPHLKHVQSLGRPHPCAALLDHLEIPLLCSSTMWVDSWSHDTPIELLSMVNTFIRYAERYLASRIFNIIRLDYTPEKYVSLECETKRPVKCQFRLSFPLHMDHDSTLLATFVNHLALLDLSSFTRLRLRTNGPLKSSFAPLFNRLSSLNTMSIDTRALGYLMVLQDHMIATNLEETTIVFPLLKVINVGATSGGFTAKHVEITMKYILPRIRNGYPIARLNISKNSPLDVPPGSDAFAEAKGLKVK